MSPTSELRVLLLNLDPPTRIALRRTLSAGGFSVFEAETPEDAERLLAGADVGLTIAPTNQIFPNQHHDNEVQDI